MRKNFLCRLIGCALLSGAVAIGGNFTAEAAVQHVKATTVVGDLGEEVTALEVTVDNPGDFTDAIVNSYKLNGNSAKLSATVNGNLVKIALPPTSIKDFSLENKAADLLIGANDLGDRENISTKDFEAQNYTASNGVTVNYRIRKSKTQNQPLVITMHGAGECGSDNNIQITANRGAVAWAEYSPNATILAPQYPAKYNTPFKDGEEKIMQDYLFALDELVTNLTKSGIVDNKRIYAAGISMGGGLTYEYATRYPGRFAALVTFSPRGTIARSLKNMDRLKAISSTPVYLIHAAGDVVNPVSNSLDIYEKMIELGNANTHMSIYDLTDSEMQGLHSHLSWVAGLHDKAMMDWLFSQSK